MPRRVIEVVEDEATIASALEARLVKEGFDVALASDGYAALETFERARPDLVILDLMLPGRDGLEVCRRVQARRAVPILMLTARDSETDMLVGLGVGADDYMTKPFSMRELVARVHALLRRVQRAPRPPSEAIELGDLRIDPARRVVRRGAETVHLTPIEFDLLFHLASQPDVVHTREQLLVEVWGYRDQSGARTVDTHVRALRKKLGNDLIRTVHGYGYALRGGAA